ncbi:MAG TPA: FeoA domain-containing protein [Deltaproteobacteria bacterium]|nr:FeoA domain-containing protein [Deltaproteobacteria bacterium]
MKRRKGPSWAAGPKNVENASAGRDAGAAAPGPAARGRKRLDEIPEGACAKITRIFGGRHLRLRLSGLGLLEGSRVRLVKSAPFSGPLLLEDVDTGARVMIGKGMASSIEVDADGSS